MSENDNNIYGETLIQDGYGSIIEVYQSDNVVFLDEPDIAKILSIKFDITFSYDDIIDMVANKCAKE
jgi:hypothetical protein